MAGGEAAAIHALFLVLFRVFKHVIEFMRKHTSESASEQHVGVFVIVAPHGGMNGQQTTFEFYKSVERRLDQLPGHITAGIDTDKIAAQIGEGIRQQVKATGLTDTAAALKSTSATLSAALKEFSTTAHDFSDPKGGTVSRIQTP